MFSEFVLAHVLTVQLLLFCPGVAVDGDWEYCPTNITVFVNCSTTIYATFNTTTGHMCNESGFVYHIFIRDSNSSDVNQFKKFGLEDPVPPVVIEGTNGQSCNISETSVVDRAPGVYDIKFLFVYTMAPITKECHDTLFVEDIVPLPPTIISANVTCDGALLIWEGRTSTFILEYIVTVQGVALTHTISGNDTTLLIDLIPFKEGLEHDKECNISLTAVYCDGVGNTSTVSIYTAIAPLIGDHSVQDSYSNFNSSHWHIYKTFKITASDCEVSHPKTATIALNCTSSSPHSNWDHRTMSQPVIVHDDTVIVDIIVPVDSLCSVELTFDNNGYKTTPTNPSDISTNQLKSCSFSVIKDVILVFCEFSEFSSLWGCRAELNSTIDSINPLSYIDIADMSANDHKRFYNVCNGVHVLKCYGLEKIYPTATIMSSITDGTISTIATKERVVEYDGAGYGSASITVNSGRHCDTVTMTTSTTTQVTTSTPPSPSINPVTTDHESNILLEVILPVSVAVLVSLLIVVGTIIVAVFIIKKRKKGKYRTAGTDDADKGSLSEHSNDSTGANEPLAQNPSEPAIDEVGKDDKVTLSNPPIVPSIPDEDESKKNVEVQPTPSIVQNDSINGNSGSDDGVDEMPKFELDKNKASKKNPRHESIRRRLTLGRKTVPKKPKLDTESDAPKDGSFQLKEKIERVLHGGEGQQKGTNDSGRHLLSKSDNSSSAMAYVEDKIDEPAFSPSKPLQSDTKDGEKGSSAMFQIPQRVKDLEVLQDNINKDSSPPTSQPPSTSPPPPTSQPLSSDPSFTKECDGKDSEDKTSHSEDKSLDTLQSIDPTDASQQPVSSESQARIDEGKSGNQQVVPQQPDLRPMVQVDDKDTSCSSKLVYLSKK